jgi:hypothetical protein
MEIRKLKLGGVRNSKLVKPAGAGGQHKKTSSVAAGIIDFRFVEIKPGSLHCASPRVRSSERERKERGLASVGVTVFVLGGRIDLDRARLLGWIDGWRGSEKPHPFKIERMRHPTAVVMLNLLIESKCSSGSCGGWRSGLGPGFEEVGGVY